MTHLTESCLSSVKKWDKEGKTPRFATTVFFLNGKEVDSICEAIREAGYKVKMPQPCLLEITRD